MCRLYGFRSNEATKVECTLVHAQNSLLLQSQNDEIGRSHPDGWGIAYFEAGQPRLEKSSAAAFEGLHFSNTAERVFSTTVVSHVRLATVGKPSTQNCHPFQWGNWVFAHNGTVTGIDALRSELTSEISRALQCEILGTTDSELLFHWLVQRALDAEAIDKKGCLSLEVLSNVVASSIAELDFRCNEASPKKQAKLNTILTDGNVLVASRLRNSLCIVHRDGIRDCEICGIPHVTHHAGTPYFAVVIASEPLSHEDWELIPDAHIVSVDESMVTQMQPIPVHAIVPAVHSYGCNDSHNERSAGISAEQIAERLRLQTPSLRLDSLLESVRCKTIEELPSLHVDDFSVIPNIARSKHVFYQERARLRAVDGDWLATAVPQVPGYEHYCQEQLGLGAVRWTCPDTRGNPIRLAEACWQDRGVRRDLVHAIRSEGLRYIHPHMGTAAVWELALLLHQTSHRPVKVIAPPPGVTDFVNDKGQFLRLTRTVLGPGATPPGQVVWNIATAAKQLQALGKSNAKSIVVKLPNAAGGAGNLVLKMNEVRQLTLTEIDDLLRKRLPEIYYDSGDELLVSQWTVNVFATPSAQIWIPPVALGRPTISGLFNQIVSGAQGNFSGCRAADFPDALQTRIEAQCLLLAAIYQQLGYVGRCSFDLILVGQDIDSCDVQFIECNGRWGGTSLPMQLMNQIFGSWNSQPFVSRKLHVPGISRISFDQVCESFGPELYSHRTGQGRYLLANPQRMASRDEVSLITILDFWDQEAAMFQKADFILKSLVAVHAVDRNDSLAK